MVYFLIYYIYYCLLLFQVYRRHSINACCVYEERTTWVKAAEASGLVLIRQQLQELAGGEGRKEAESEPRAPGAPRKADASRCQERGQPRPLPV